MPYDPITKFEWALIIAGGSVTIISLIHNFGWL